MKIKHIDKERGETQLRVFTDKQMIARRKLYKAIRQRIRRSRQKKNNRSAL